MVYSFIECEAYYYLQFKMFPNRYTIVVFSIYDIIYMYTYVVGHEMERFICEKINRNILIQLGYLTND